MNSKIPQGPYCAVFKSLSKKDFLTTINHHLLSFLGRDPQRAGSRDLYKALAYTIRDFLIERWISTQKGYYAKGKKRVYYLSLEFLIGRSLGNSLINLGFYDVMKEVMEEMGYDLEEVREEEDDAALGNGGLGRLAACFLDSLATLGVPAYGYGIRYEYGLFFQRVVDGFQVEHPDNWLRYGTPWEYERPTNLYPVQYYGRVQRYRNNKGELRTEWIETEEIMAMACDVLVPGFNNDNVINMRLWTARASRELDLGSFNRGDYISAVQEKVQSETISKVLYPSDDIRQGQELRLKQQYFFVAATFQDIFRRHKKKHNNFDSFADEIAVQLNDTHPAIAIPEFMRLLVDEESVPWEKAWQICVGTFGYTNHTLMPEALESWSVELLGKVLPRHLEIIYEINRQFLDEVAARYPGRDDLLRAMSIIEEGPVKRVRMAYLAIVGSHSVNGVAELHTHLLKTRLFKDFHEFYPGRFNCKTNGITQRRWLLKCNPGLAGLITATIGGEWVTNLDYLRNLEPYADQAKFQKKWAKVKMENKKRLAVLIKQECGVAVNPNTLFDVQVKRIHEYKRQLLNVLHVITLYHRIANGEDTDSPSRTIVFGGKAAPSYFKAKLIIKLITSVAEVVNNDSRIGDRLKMAFIPNYGVSVAEKIFPASDLSEQISTAGTEASGTGNMKFSLNGALTIGTLDGANIEIREEVGAENIFIFGMTTEEVEEAKRNPRRNGFDVYRDNAEVKRTLDSIGNGYFSKGDTRLFAPIVEGLLNHNDPYLLLLDLEDYLRCQKEVGELYRDQPNWIRKSILNVARMGKFSSDRTIREYARDIWGVPVD
ncbi:MAG: glycogen/starch/alpha-glucan phosphorylase [Proteobacteria bacterium]|nr:glycogen/starch/alpha-glucan phosphorylase [Pseudomonadota bacterium]MBU1546263.1 glycogen/starch/alpha-glucan phosphorylase [Pseudomonadota bacterium]MBU2618209.1 glycogen/starch/alpha-glucan phosphorylase [Pseudomonadota bacterium]